LFHLEGNRETMGGPDSLHVESSEGNSWTGWAWNVGTSVGSILLPVYWEDVESENEMFPALDVRREKITHFGFFVDSASLVI